MTEQVVKPYEPKYTDEYFKKKFGKINALKTTKPMTPVMREYLVAFIEATTHELKLKALQRIEEKRDEDKDATIKSMWNDVIEYCRGQLKGE